MKSIRHIRIDITPMDFLGRDDAVLHKMRVSVSSNAHQFEQDVVITEDDFTSRFDWIFESCLRTLKEELKRAQEKERSDDG